MSENIITKIYQSPCGELMLGSYGDRLCLCDWTTAPHADAVKRRLQRELSAGFITGSSDVTVAAQAQLDEFFHAGRKDFDVPLLFAGTALQKAVWGELIGIDYGRTVSYLQLAERSGRPRAVRAVANAVGANALSVIVPCHRVIGSDGSLTGYAGGTEAKRMLLMLEGAITGELL